MNKKELLKEIPFIWYLSDDDKQTVFWKTADRKYFGSDVAFEKHNNERANRPAGSKQKDGYIRITWKGKKYLAHHIAFALSHGKWPQEGSELDHENRVRDDNSKLREVPKIENLANRGGIFGQIKADRKSAIMGFSFDEADGREADTSVLGDGAENGAENDRVLSEADTSVLDSDKTVMLHNCAYLSNFLSCQNEMVKIYDIELKGPNNEALSVRGKRLKLDKENLRNETQNIEFDYFEELQVVRVKGEREVYLADGFMRLEAYKRECEYESIPCRVHVVEKKGDVARMCVEISADYNTRPKADIDRDFMREGLYQQVWKLADIDAKKGSVIWPGGMTRFAEKFRVHRNTLGYMKKIVEHLVKNDIDRISYKADSILFKERKTERGDCQMENLQEEEKMRADIIKKVDELIKSNEFGHVMNDPAFRAEIFERMCGGMNAFKETVEERFDISAIEKQKNKVKAQVDYASNEYGAIEFE